MLQNLHEQIKDIETIKLENRGKGFLFREIAEKQIRNFITKQIKDIDDGKKISTETPLAQMNTNKLYEFLESVYCSDENIKKCCNAIKETEVTKSNADTIPETNS